MQLDLDPSSLRDWMAGVGLLRILSETSEARMIWRRGNRYTLHIEGAPDDAAARCAAWIEDHRAAWGLSGCDHDQISPKEWRERTRNAGDLELVLWCVAGSDGVSNGELIRSTMLKNGYGYGAKNWFSWMRAGIAIADEKRFKRVFAGERDERQGARICRWSPECVREHAYRARDPVPDKMSQDQMINALAAVGVASCPSAPGRDRLRTPLVHGDAIEWPIWTESLRIADLEAALCCGWSWPTMSARRWVENQVLCVSRGELREPEASAA